MDSFQYHPTGIAYPAHLAGGLISEAARSAGAKLINGQGERFVDELRPRDIVAAAILRECAEGRGVERDGQVGVFLDTPTLEAEKPGILEKRSGVACASGARNAGLDPGAGAFPGLSDAALPERRHRHRRATGRPTCPGCSASARSRAASTAATG